MKSSNLYFFHLQSQHQNKTPTYLSTTKCVAHCFPIRRETNMAKQPFELLVFQDVANKSPSSPSHIDQLLCFLNLFSWARAKDNLARLLRCFDPRIATFRRSYVFRGSTFLVSGQFSRMGLLGCLSSKHDNRLIEYATCSLLNFFPIDTWDQRHTLQFSGLFMHILPIKNQVPKWTSPSPACAVGATKTQWLALLLESDPWSQNQLQSKTERNWMDLGDLIRCLGLNFGVDGDTSWIK